MIYRLIYLLMVIAFAAAFIFVQVSLPPVPVESWPLVAFLCVALIAVSVGGLVMIALVWIDRAEKDHRNTPRSRG